MITIYNGQCYYLHGGSSSKGFELGASYLLFWEIIQDLKYNHFNLFNLGGVPKEAENGESLSHGLFRFKRGFGTRIIACMGGTKVLNPLKNKIYKVIKR